MASRKHIPSIDVPSSSTARVKFSNKAVEKVQDAELESIAGPLEQPHVDIDLREIYFLIMHFLSAGPCQRTYGQFWNELLEHQLLPRRYHAWYSRSGIHCGDENDNDMSFPLSYNQLVERYPHVETAHLVNLLKQLLLSRASPLHGMIGGNKPNAADVPTLLGSASFSLLEADRNRADKPVFHLPGYLRWPHMQADQVRGLNLREIGGGFTKHHRSPSIRAACYAVAKPSTMVQKMRNVKKLRGHRNAVYCAIYDRSGRYVITGSDDRLVKIWSMETAFCLASCRGHEGDITDLAVSSNNFLVASASNDFIIRVWRLPDGAPVSVLRGHTGAVTAIAFSPRPGCAHHLLSSSDDGTCRIWDARQSQSCPRVYIAKPSDPVVGKSNGPSSSTSPPSHQILCCAYNANGTIFVTGSSDTFARVWNACKATTDDPEQLNHEMDVLAGHENDVNYVQFSGCAVASRSSTTDTSKEDNIPKFKNSWFTHDNIVTCSRDGSAIIWIPRSRKCHGKAGRWTRAYHLKVPPPPMPPQTPRGGPRQRILPTPRGVNMIVWSLDNRFVLAAIMDCRICVWNAADGSLVHSLTGHTQSTYVLDVHPFNPRIAMSAGYDGQTIVWDIWEGIPIRIHETGRFKLVDGKFSPDGTSIVLSDDVGQIHILSTGEGESQKDAKYDQFFLGDYRPLIRDVHGNVMDQETQLVPYRRNIQDQLCDSSIIPYPEPYQTMYQRRRLGALGIEWLPSALNLAVGPVFDLQDYQILPLPDLDRMIEPIPEFLDAMDWEPENIIQSDDNDSEYNGTEEYCSDGDQGSLSDGSTGDLECSAEDSDMGESNKDGFPRPKRRKHKAVAEFMTSSGRRVKRRNLDDQDNTLSECNRSKKSTSRKKSKRKKLSSPKLLRPQRVAARNALNRFSQISGDSSDEDDEEDEDDSETDTSESDSLVAELTVQSRSDRSVQTVQRETKASFGECEDVPQSMEPPKSRTDAERKRLILKLPARNSKKVENPSGTPSEFDKRIYPDLQAPQKATATNTNNLSSQDLGSSSFDATDVVLPHSYRRVKVEEIEQSEKFENHLDLSAGFKEDNFRWGDSKARTSKRLRSGDFITTDTFRGSASLDEHNSVVGDEKLESEHGMTSSHLERKKPADKTDSNNYRIEGQLKAGSSEGLDGAVDEAPAPPGHARTSSPLEMLPQDDEQQKMVESPVTCSGRRQKGHRDEPGHTDTISYDESPASVAGRGDNKMELFLCHKLKENVPSVPKIRIKSRSAIYVKDGDSSKFDSPSLPTQKMISQVPEEDEGPSRRSPDHCLRASGAQTGNESRLSSLPDPMFRSDSKDNMYKAVYKRSKSSRARTDSEGDGGGMEESTSNASNHNHDLRIDFADAPSDGIRRTRSTGRRATTWESEPRSVEKFYANGHKSLLHEGWKSNEVPTIGLRSSRNRRRSNCDNDRTSPEKRKLHHSSKRLSWLMLLDHEESSRYIPQLGDHVVYLRQGHEQSELPGLRRSLKGNIRAAEFCKIENLVYSTCPGSGESCCKITLEFVDPTSSLVGQRFTLNLPELETDFIVEKTLYDASIKKNWTTRDKCKVWWKNGAGEGGSWWDGRIVSVQPKSLEFPDSPWERYTIRYRDDATDFLHSPWEFQNLEWEPLCIDEHSRTRLLSFFEKLEHSGNEYQDRYGIQKLKQVSRKSDFLNRFPVPISFDVIYSRLENSYYRNLEAVEHDFEVMLANARLYIGVSADEKKMRRLSDSFNKTMCTLYSPEG